jgi:putative flippase GtrA
LEIFMSATATHTIRALARHSAVRFLVVGGLSVLVDTTSLFVFHGVLGIWLPIATVLAFAVAFVVNFGLNRAWAFGSAGGMGPQIGRYLLLVLVNLAVTVVLVSALTWGGLPYLVAKVLVAICLALVNYVVSKRWIFA